MSPQPLELNTDCRPRSTEGLPYGYWGAMVGLSLTGSAVQTGPRFTSVLCLCFLRDSCGLLSACTNCWGAALKAWG